MNIKFRKIICAIAVLVFLAHADWASGERKVINLDGTWEIAEGALEMIPKEFSHRVPVPGLADMAEPAFEKVGFENDLREAFWYRRTFQVEGAIPEVAILKIHKAKFGTQVHLNGGVVGEHLPCFTPAFVDVREHLKGNGATNELIIRVGAFRTSVPDNIPSSWDFEKYRYIPGIYDSVKLILSGTPYIVNIQTVPEISNSRVRVTGEISNKGKAKEIRVGYTLREADTGKTVFAGESTFTKTKKTYLILIDFPIPIKNCRLWSPEDPYLYELELDTGGDTYRTRFGMRSFRFDSKTGRAVLNGKTYYMRGTNVCIYRFFEDESRGNLPWRKDWVRKLHRKFREMHWNSIRYCIGFPPDFWYDIADEEGLLIQDEFPVWYGASKEKWPVGLNSEELAREYTVWMRERWNHPCVVIWDAQNETVTEKTGKAIQAVRHLDLSNRPWDNGWSEPQAETDCVETHPYLFSRYRWKKPSEEGALADLLSTVRIPLNGPSLSKKKEFDNANIINEYGWLWLNRDGTSTVLTRDVYKTLLGENSTTSQRRQTYARNLAALTEYWRCHRKCAGVLHFCGLGYSRAWGEKRPEGGATSDNFIDVETLEFELMFWQYVRDAFAPVGLMIDEWSEVLPAGEVREFPVFVINDLYDNITATLQFRVEQAQRTIRQQTESFTIQGLARRKFTFKTKVPEPAGTYQLVAELKRDGHPSVRSVRVFKVEQPK